MILFWNAILVVNMRLLRKVISRARLGLVGTFVILGILGISFVDFFF